MTVSINILFTSVEANRWSCVCVHLSVLPSVWTHISITTSRNVLILGMMMGYGSGNVARCFKMLILSCIPDSQTKMSDSEKGSHAIKVRNSHTAANTLSALFTHVRTFHRYAGSLLTWVRMAGLLINFSDELVQSMAFSTLF